jgi:osmotically inducible lipoprotein OsmB
MRISIPNPLKTLILALPVVAMLAACGTRPGERALTGGALGAATGAALTAATGGTIWAGTLIGGAVGAVAGAATSPRQVYLGPSPFGR